jgi:hypothetical protein
MDASLTYDKTRGRWTIGTVTLKSRTLSGQTTRTWLIGECMAVIRIGRLVKLVSRNLRDGQWTAWETEIEERVETLAEAREWARELRAEARQIARTYLLAKWNEEGERWAA